MATNDEYLVGIGDDLRDLEPTLAALVREIAAVPDVPVEVQGAVRAAYESIKQAARIMRPLAQAAEDRIESDPAFMAAVAASLADTSTVRVLTPPGD